MDSLVPFLFFLVVAIVLILGPLLYRWLKFKSFSAAMLGAPIRSTLGEITLRTSAHSNSVLKVHVLGPGNGLERSVALQVVYKALLAAGTSPITLTIEQAQELSALLQNATRA